METDRINAYVVTLLNGRIRGNDFTVKTFEYRIYVFDTTEWGKAYSCASAFNFVSCSHVAAPPKEVENVAEFRFFAPLG